MSTENLPLTHEVQLVDEIHEVTLIGSLCDDGIDAARNLLCQTLDAGAKNIALQMQGIDYISSSGIGMLVSVLKKCHQAKVNFALLGPSSDIHELFTLTRLDQVFTIAPSVAAWKRSL